MSERRGSGREGYNVLYNIIIYRGGKLLKKNWERIERQRKRKREKERERKAHSKYNLLKYTPKMYNIMVNCSGHVIRSINCQK